MDHEEETNFGGRVDTEPTPILVKTPMPLTESTFSFKKNIKKFWKKRSRVNLAKELSDNFVMNVFSCANPDGTDAITRADLNKVVSLEAQQDNIVSSSFLLDIIIIIIVIIIN